MPASLCVEAKFIRKWDGELITFVYIMHNREAADIDKYVQKQGSPKNLVYKYLGKNFSTLCYKYKTQGKSRCN